jgi:methylmalonyl-CoA mutase N-terminal domain/subunit
MKSLGAKSNEAMMLRFHTQTGGSTLTAQQPENNISRVTIQAMAAVLGGTQSLHTNGFDEALNLPTEKAARTALRTQQIIGFESGIANTVDPLGGSYFVEELTNAIEAEALKLMDQISEMGGAVSAVENGWIQDQIANSSYIYQKEVESKESIVVGVNQFQVEEVASPPSFKINDSIRDTQTQKINELKAKRSNIKVTESLQKHKAACSTSNNLMPYILDAVEQYATLGEIADILRSEFGEFA